MTLQFLSNHLGTTHGIDLQYGIFVGLCEYFGKRKYVYIISYHQAKLLIIMIQDLSFVIFLY